MGCRMSFAGLSETLPTACALVFFSSMRGLYPTRRMCGDGDNVLASSMWQHCRSRLLGKSWQQSSTQRRTWAALVDQDTAKKRQ